MVAVTNRGKIRRSAFPESRPDTGPGMLVAKDSPPKNSLAGQRWTQTQKDKLFETSIGETALAQSVAVYEGESL